MHTKRKLALKENTVISYNGKSPKASQANFFSFPFPKNSKVFTWSEAHVWDWIVMVVVYIELFSLYKLQPFAHREEVEGVALVP